MAETNQEIMQDFQQSCARFNRACYFRAAQDHLRANENYDLLQIIGRGNIGTVIQVREKTTKEEYAAKINVSGILFREELQIWPLMQHDNILKLHDAIHVPNTRAYVFVTDLAIGTLATAFEDNEKSQIPNKLYNVKKWFAGVLKGLSYLHEIGYAHLDITYKNVLISRNSEAIIGDFNCISRATAPVEYYGVPLPYVPPELWTSEYTWKPIDAKPVDLYTCGVMFLELCSNYRLYLKVGFSEDNPKISNYKKDILPVIRQQIVCLEITTAAFYPKTFGGKDNDVEELSHLISLLVDVAPKRRISAERAAEHNFFQEKEDKMHSEAFSKMIRCCCGLCVKANLNSLRPKTSSARKSENIQEQNEVLHSSNEVTAETLEAGSCKSSDEVSSTSETKDGEDIENTQDDPEKEKKSKKRRILSWFRKKARRISKIFKK